MNGLTDYITSGRWEDIFTIWYVIVDGCVSQIVSLRDQRQ
jgi:hypothetical protein